MPDDPKSTSTANAATYMNVLEGNQQAFARWFQGMFAVSQEITHFTQARLHEAMTTSSMLAGCASPEQALDCQRRFATRAAEKYTEEMSKLSRMMISIARDNISSPQPEATRKMSRE
jgi:hypothetical protein